MNHEERILEILGQIQQDISELKTGQAVVEGRLRHLEHGQTHLTIATESLDRKPPWRAAWSVWKRVRPSWKPGKLNWKLGRQLSKKILKKSKPTSNLCGRILTISPTVLAYRRKLYTKS